MEMPGGSPEMEYVNGARPPDTIPKMVSMAASTRAVLGPIGRRRGGGGLTLIVKPRVATRSLLSSTLTVKGKRPIDVGVPEM